MMDLDLKQLLRDVILASVAALSGAILGSATLNRAVLIAGGYAAVRAVAGILYSWASGRVSG